jgi:hypothetical protein
VKLAVITACCYPSTDRIHYLLESAKTHGIDVNPFGVGTSFGGWGHTKGPLLLGILKELECNDYTHVLYTDGADALFLTGLEEILSKYWSLHAPLVMSAETDLYPPIEGLAEGFDRLAPNAPWRYPNAGQFIGEIPYIRHELESAYSRFGDNGNDNSWWVRAWFDTEFLQSKLDIWCQIFQSMSGCPSGLLTCREGRLWNRHTGTNPCLVHFNGGYSDPATGRDETLGKFLEELKGESRG